MHAAVTLHAKTMICSPGAEALTKFFVGTMTGPNAQTEIGTAALRGPCPLLEGDNTKAVNLITHADYGSHVVILPGFFVHKLYNFHK